MEASDSTALRLQLCCLKEGPLMYYNDTGRRSRYQDRWGVLWKTGEFCIFKDKTKKKLKLQLSLSTCRVTEQNNSIGQCRSCIEIESETPYDQRHLDRGATNSQARRSHQLLARLATKKPQDFEPWLRHLTSVSTSAAIVSQLTSTSAAEDEPVGCTARTPQNLPVQYDHGTATPALLEADRVMGQPVMPRARSTLDQQLNQLQLPSNAVSLVETASQFFPDDAVVHVAFSSDNLAREGSGDPLAYGECRTAEKPTNGAYPGKWRKGRLLARGGCGSVYEATMEEMGGRWAVKIIRPPWTESANVEHRDEAAGGAYGAQPALDRKPSTCSHQELCERALSSAIAGDQNLCGLSHRNIVRFYHLEQLGPHKAALFMELLDGTTLHNAIGDRPMEVQRIRHISKQICSALAYIHGLQPTPIIHRDINAKNIMLLRDSNDTVKLIDFGLSLVLKQSVTHYSTESTAPKGTLHFMAPELVAPPSDTDKVRYSRETDVWAFGCLVYLMATGEVPYASCSNILAMATRLDKNGAPDLHETEATEAPYSCSNSAELTEFYQSCTARNREDRWSAQRLMGHAFIAGDEEAMSHL